MNSKKQQFNVYLDPELVTAIKHRAIDEQFSLSDLVGKVLKSYLETPMTQQPANLILQPMVHVENMAEAVDFFLALGAKIMSGSRDGDWTQLALGGAEIGLLAHPPQPRTE